MRRLRRRMRWLIGILAGCLAAPFLAVAGYHCGIEAVPPFQPRLVRPPEPNGYERAAAALKPLEGYRIRYPAGWPDAEPEQLHAIVPRLSPVLASVRKTFPLEWQQPEPFPAADTSPLFGQHARFREAARGFVAESRLSQLQNDRPTLQGCLDAMELGAQVSRGASLLGRLTGITCHTVGMAEAERVADAVPKSEIPDALRRVRRIETLWPTVAETLEQERLYTLALHTYSFRTLRSLPVGEKLDGMRSVAEEKGWRFAIGLYFTPRAVSLDAISRYFEALSAQAALPYRERRPPPHPKDPYAAVLADLSPETYWILDRPRTQLYLLECALAVRYFRERHGRFPRTLPEIERVWLPDVPRDLWDQPLVYRLRNGKPVLYSLGADGRDDGGRPTSDPDWRQPSRGDRVFGALIRRTESDGTAPSNRADNSSKSMEVP